MTFSSHRIDTAIFAGCLHDSISRVSIPDATGAPVPKPAFHQHQRMRRMDFFIPGMMFALKRENQTDNVDSPESERAPAGITPEARVLIVMTGGTICMEKSEYGLIPARNFLERCMAPRPEFNDGTDQGVVEVRVEVDGSIVSKNLRSLRTPTSSYGKRVR